VATTSSNKLYAACCPLAPAIPVFPLCSPSSLGGEGSSGKSRVFGGSRGGRSSASLARVRGTGGVPAVFASPSSPLLFGLGGEGKGDMVGLHAGNSILFFKRDHRYSCCSAKTPVHLAGRGGEEVSWSLLWSTRASIGPLWEPLEFRLSTVLHPRPRCHASATRGHRSGHAVLVAQSCASFLL
jgi:hypothetical protein